MYRKKINKPLSPCQEKRENEIRKAKDKASALKSAAIKDAAEKARKDEEMRLTKFKLPDLMKWIRSFSYTRRLSFIPRDFSDGVLVAEIIKKYLPSLVDLHNYISANGRSNKIVNWSILNRKVFSQLGFQVTQTEIDEITAPQPFNPPSDFYPIEKFLFKLQHILAALNPAVYDYRNKPSTKDPFMKKSTKKVIRPMTRQPMTSGMWRLERDVDKIYGKYKGNPIIWDSLPPDKNADLEFASIGISRQRFQQIKQRRKQQEVNERNGESSPSDLKCAIETRDKTCLNCPSKFESSLRESKEQTQVQQICSSPAISRLSSTCSSNGDDQCARKSE